MIDAAADLQGRERQPGAMPAADARLLADARWLRRLSRRLVRDSLMADDVCQEALVASLDSPGGVGRSWLGGVARNIAATLSNREARRRVVESSTDRREPAAPTDEIVAEAELQRAAVDALIQLAEPYRSTLLLRFMKGMSVRAVASRMRVPVETVRTRQQRALAQLRRRLDRRPGGVRALVMPLVGSSWTSPLIVSLLGILAMQTKTVVLGAATVLVAAFFATTWVMSDPDSASSPVPSNVPAVVERAGAGEQPETLARREEIPAKIVPAVVPSDPTTGSLLVRVFYAEDKAPVSDVNVFVGEVDTWRTHRDFLKVRTDERGEARFSGLSPGKFFSNTDRFLGAKRFEIVAGKETTVDCELQGFILTGIVVDSKDGPVPDADVILYTLSGEFGHTVAKTDAQGRFHLRGLGVCCVGARARGHAPSVRQTVIAEVGMEKDVRITLPGLGGAVSGRIVDVNGAGIPGVFVQIGDARPQESITLPDGAQARPAEAANTLTDEDGRFLLRAVPTGAQPAFAQERSRSTPFAPVTGEVQVLAGQTVTWNQTLVRGGMCEGVVTDESGNPIEGVRVSVYLWPRSPFSVTTASDGRYRLLGLPLGILDVRANSTDHGKAKKQVEARSGETVRCDFQLALPTACKGRVTDLDNQPIRGARVTVDAPWSAERSFWSKFLTTDASGEFEVTGFPRGPLCFRVEHAEYEPLEDFWVESVGDRVALQLSYEGKAAGKIVGRLVDPQGEPIKEARVWVMRDGEASPGLSFSIAHQNRAPKPLGPNGEFENWRRLRPGAYTLFAMAAGYPLWRSAKISLAKGQKFDAGRIALAPGGTVRFDLDTPASKPRSILMVFREGEPLGLRVDTRNSPTQSLPLAPGKYVARLGGVIIPRKIPFVVRAGDETRLRVSVEEGQPVSLRFVMPRGARPQQLLAVMTHADGRVFEYLPLRFRGGQFLGGTALPPGRYKVRVTSTDGVHGDGEFTVQADETERQYVPIALRR